MSVRAPVGPTNVTRTQSCIGRGLAALRANSGVDSAFLLYALKHAEKSISALGVGSTFTSINRDDIEEIQISVPDLPTQKRLAALLTRADRLRRIRQFALDEVDKLTMSAFQLEFGDLRCRCNSKGWNLTTVEGAGSVQLGRQRAPKYQSGKFTKPYLRVANVYEDRLELSDVLHMDFDAKDFEAYRLEVGDILLNEGQSTELVGRPAIWNGEITDCCFQNTLIRFQANLKKCEPKFALWVFINYLRNGMFAQVSSKTSSIAHLGAARLAEMPFPLPPLPLQKKFAQLSARHTRLRHQHAAALDSAHHLFQSLLQQVFGE